MSNQYRDGTYEATGWYGGLPSHLDVTISVEAGTITSVEVSTPAEDPVSLDYQRAFAVAVPDAVVGHELDGMRISRVAGASGCTDGFNDALDKIRAEAARG